MHKSISPIIIDTDHIRQLLQKTDLHTQHRIGQIIKNFQEQQKIKGIKKITNDISECIFDSITNQHISHYILGVAGVGKSTYAMQNLKGIYTNDISTLLDMIESGDSSFIVINAEKPRKEIADKAEEIIILDAPEEFISNQRKERGEKDTLTNFGRSEHATRGAGLSNSVAKSLCNTFYPEKTKIATMNDDKTWDILPISAYKIIKITCESIVQLAGKFSPSHLGHTTMIAIKDCKEKILDVLYLGKGYEPMDKYVPEHTQIIMSGSESLQGLTHSEKVKLLQKIPGFELLVFESMMEFGGRKYLDCGEGKVIEVDMEHSIGVLGKDRLPVGFTSGYIDDPLLQKFINSHPHTNDSPTVSLLSMIASGIKYFIRADDQTDTKGVELSSSAYRKEIFKDKPDYDLISSMFDPHIAPYMIHPHNIEVIKKRLMTKENLYKDYTIAIQSIKESYIMKYKEKYGEADFYTKSKKGKKPKYKNFNLNLVLKNDLQSEEKKEFIQKYKDEMLLQEKNMKKLYHEMTEGYKLILDDSILKKTDSIISE